MAALSTSPQASVRPVGTQPVAKDGTQCHKIWSYPSNNDDFTPWIVFYILPNFVCCGIFDFYLFYFMILFWGVSSIPEIRIFSQQRKRKKNLSLLSVCLCRSALYQSRSSSQLPRIPENWHQLQSIDRLCFSNQWIFLFFTKRVQKQLFVVVQLLYLGVNCVRGTFG